MHCRTACCVHCIPYTNTLLCFRIDNLQNTICLLFPTSFSCAFFFVYCNSAHCNAVGNKQLIYSSSLVSSSLVVFNHSMSFVNEFRIHSLLSSSSSCHDKILSSVIISLSYKKWRIWAIFDFSFSFWWQLSYFIQNTNSNFFL